MGAGRTWLRKLAGGANHRRPTVKNGQPRQGRWIKNSVHQIQRRCGVTIPDIPHETSGCYGAPVVAGCIDEPLRVGKRSP